MWGLSLSFAKALSECELNRPKCYYFQHCSFSSIILATCPVALWMLVLDQLCLLHDDFQAGKKICFLLHSAAALSCCLHFCGYRKCLLFTFPLFANLFCLVGVASLAALLSCIESKGSAIFDTVFFSCKGKVFLSLS